MPRCPKKKAPKLPVTGWRALAIDPEYTFVDKGLYFFSIAYVGILVVLFFAGTSYALSFETTDSQWMTFWQYYVWIMLGLGVVATLWLLIGGMHDLVAMMRALSKVQRDIQDDGTVTHKESDKKEDSQVLNHGKEKNNNMPNELWNNRFLTLNAVIRVNQIETTRNDCAGVDEYDDHRPGGHLGFA